LDNGRSLKGRLLRTTPEGAVVLEMVVGTSRGTVTIRKEYLESVKSIAEEKKM